jgi:hypothetical protein
MASRASSRTAGGLDPAVAAAWRSLQLSVLDLLLLLGQVEDLRPAMTQSGALARAIFAAERHGGSKAAGGAGGGADGGASTVKNGIHGAAKTLAGQLVPFM